MHDHVNRLARCFLGAGLVLSPLLTSCENADAPSTEPNRASEPSEMPGNAPGEPATVRDEPAVAPEEPATSRPSASEVGDGDAVEVPGLGGLDQRLDQLNGRILEGIRELIDTYGRDESGAFSKYAGRLEAGEGLTGYERELVRHLVTAFDPRQLVVVHPSCGFATLDLALVSEGVSCVAIEANGKRYFGAGELRNLVLADDAAALERLALRLGSVDDAEAPDAADGVRSVLVITDATTGSEIPSEVFQRFTAFDNVILESRRFGLIRNEESERAALVEEICTATGAEATPLDVGRGYFFVQFKLR